MHILLIHLFHVLGEVVDTGIINKNSKKLFDETIDSGISESSVTSEVLREKTEPGSSRHNDIKIKQERESSVESSSRKRKASTESNSSSTVTPIAKKIKAEPDSSDDELDFIFGKKESYANSTFNKTPVSSKKSKEKSSGGKKKTTLSASLIESANFVEEEKPSSSKEKKSKKKKKRLNLEDDFETSLQLLLDSSRIKKEK